MVPKKTTSETSAEELDPTGEDAPGASEDAGPGLSEEPGTEGEPSSAEEDQPLSMDPAEIEKELEAELGDLAEDDVPGPDEEMEQARKEMDELRDRHLRLAAEFENYRKRVSADLAGSWARAQAELAGKLAGTVRDQIGEIRHVLFVGHASRRTVKVLPSHLDERVEVASPKTTGGFLISRFKSCHPAGD